MTRRSFGSAYGRKPKSNIRKSTHEPNDPNRYLVQPLGSGECVVRDRDSNAIVAHLDTRAEADAWVKDKVSA